MVSEVTLLWRKKQPWHLPREGERLLVVEMLVTANICRLAICYYPSLAVGASFALFSFGRVVFSGSLSVVIAPAKAAVQFLPPWRLSYWGLARSGAAAVLITPGFNRGIFDIFTLTAV